MEITQLLFCKWHSKCFFLINLIVKEIIIIEITQLLLSKWHSECFF